jgi:arginase
MPAKKTIINTMAYLGAAISEGQGTPGTHLGPDAYRKAGLISGLKSKFNVNKITDYGNISMADIPQSEIVPMNQPFNILNGDLLPPLMKRLSKKVEEINSQADLDFLLTVGGDHSIGSATISGMLNRFRNLKVIWVDAHADMVNPEHAVRDQYNYHGMPLGHVSGCYKLNGFDWMNLLPKENIVLIGIRDIEEGEYETIKKHNIKAYSMEHVDKFGIGEVMRQTMEYLDPKGDSPFHISFDVDGLDPEYFSQTGTLFRHGLSAR